MHLLSFPQNRARTSPQQYPALRDVIAVSEEGGEGVNRIASGIATAIHFWNTAPKAEVISLAERRRMRWVKRYTRPMLPPSGDAA